MPLTVTNQHYAIFVIGVLFFVSVFSNQLNGAPMPFNAHYQLETDVQGFFEIYALCIASIIIDRMATH